MHWAGGLPADGRSAHCRYGGRHPESALDEERLGPARYDTRTCSGWFAVRRRRSFWPAAFGWSPMPVADRPARRMARRPLRPATRTAERRGPACRVSEIWTPKPSGCSGNFPQALSHIAMTHAAVTPSPVPGIRNALRQQLGQFSLQRGLRNPSGWLRT